MAASSAIHPSGQCSEDEGEGVDGTNSQHATIRHAAYAHGEVLTTVSNEGVPFGGKSGDDDVHVRDDDEDLASSLRPVAARRESVDELAEKYSEMDTSDDEQDAAPNGDGNTKIHWRHAKKLAKGYKKEKTDHEKLKAKYSSHWRFAEAVQNERDELKRKLNELKARNAPDEEMVPLRQEFKKRKAIMEMLKYGVQSKCGVCYKNRKISESHPYSKVVLETVLGANYSGIYDLQQREPLQPSSCAWRHLCASCDEATGSAERCFKDDLVNVLDSDNPAASVRNRGLINLSHADLFHVYTFRGLFRNVDIHHYIPDCEENTQGCSCSNLLFDSLSAFLKRIYHLSLPFVWKNRPESHHFIKPSEAGMLFHVGDKHSPPEHWIEFPFICKVTFESDQKTHYLVFAQIPPFYWAFPLPLDGQEIPETIPHECKSSDKVVKEYYREAIRDAEQLSESFEQIITDINNQLQYVRKNILSDDLKMWHKRLMTEKEKVTDDGKKFDDDKRALLKEKEDLRDQFEVERKEHNDCSLEMNEIHEQIKKLEREENETRITKRKEPIVRQLQHLTSTERKRTQKLQEINRRMIAITDKLNANTEKLESKHREYIDLVKRGLHAQLEPKLIIGYFRTSASKCYMEVVID